MTTFWWCLLALLVAGCLFMTWAFCCVAALADRQLEEIARRLK